MSQGNYVTAFITGHSVPGCTGLSAVQRGFQQRTWIPQERWWPWNFPFHATEPFPEDYPLLAASWNNVMHFLKSQRQGFRELHSDAVSRFISQYDKVLLVASSCGVELLRNLNLPADVTSRMYVFGCGAVSLGLPEVASMRLVQGKWDLLSRLFHWQVDYRYPCGHMSYLEAEETLRHFDDYSREVLS